MCINFSGITGTLYRYRTEITGRWVWRDYPDEPAISTHEHLNPDKFPAVYPASTGLNCALFFALSVSVA